MDDPTKSRRTFIVTVLDLLFSGENAWYKFITGVGIDLLGALRMALIGTGGVGMAFVAFV